MNKDITINEFIQLVLNKKIYANQKVQISSDELLDLLKEKLELEKQVEILEKAQSNSNAEKELEIRKLNFLLDSEKSLNRQLETKIITLMEHERIQRQRANGYKQKLQQQVFQDTSFSYTVKLGNLK